MKNCWGFYHFRTPKSLIGSIWDRQAAILADWKNDAFLNLICIIHTHTPTHVGLWCCSVSLIVFGDTLRLKCLFEGPLSSKSLCLQPGQWSYPHSRRKRRPVKVKEDAQVNPCFVWAKTGGGFYMWGYEMSKRREDVNSPGKKTSHGFLLPAFQTSKQLKLHPGAVAGRGKVLLCTVRLKYHQHKEKIILSSREVVAPVPLSQPFFSVSSVLHRDCQWSRKHLLNQLPPSICRISPPIGQVCGGFFRGSLWIFCGSTRWHTTSLSKTAANKY